MTNPHQIDTSGPDYNPSTCITAEELRELGLSLPEEIPDCAWVPRESVQWSFPQEQSQEEKLESLYNGVLTIQMVASFSEPFRCYRAILPVIISENLEFPVDDDDSTDNLSTPG